MHTYILANVHTYIESSPAKQVKHIETKWICIHSLYGYRTLNRHLCFPGEHTHKYAHTHTLGRGRAGIGAHTTMPCYKRTGGSSRPQFAENKGKRCICFHEIYKWCSVGGVRCNGRSASARALTQSTCVCTTRIYYTYGHIFLMMPRTQTHRHTRKNTHTHTLYAKRHRG